MLLGKRTALSGMMESVYPGYGAYNVPRQDVDTMLPAMMVKMALPS